MQPTDKQAKLFAKYISDKKVLIADASSTSRGNIANNLVKMGAKTSNLILCQSYEIAEEELKRHSPQVVIADYDLERRCGLDLLQTQRALNKDAKSALFILVTGNTSQSAVAKSAEEDVDTYIIKPFTAEVLRLSILKTALAKINPPEYIVTIEKGKELLENKKVDEAIKTFEEAMTMDPNPSLACFYLGQARIIKKATEQAEGSFHRGLQYNKIHYKCLVGLFDILMDQKRHKDAYEVIRKIAHYFPANPQRLTTVLRLAIITQSYEDVERYYRIFTTIDTRNEEMVKYICAALVVCGKYYLQQNSQSRALELFQKAAITASGRTRILREIILALVEFDLSHKAGEYLSRFPAETQKSSDYLSMDLLIKEKVEPVGRLIDYGRELLKNEIHDPVVYEVLIRKSQDAKLNDYAETLVGNAAKRWPERANFFNGLLRKKSAAAAG